MPQTDVLPLAAWQDLRTVMVKNPSPSDLDLARLFVGGSEMKSVQSFTHLRAAIEFLFEHLELPERTVLFPRYICGSVVRAAKRAGLAVRFCDVDSRSGALSFEALKQHPTHKIGTVFLVHAFGIPAEIEEISKYCKEHKISLIEDCAHVLNADQRERPLGTYGDFALFHFAKKIPNVHGGLLISYKKVLPHLEKRARPKIKELIALWMKWDFLRPVVNLLRSATPSPEDNDEGADRSHFQKKSASRGSKRLALKQIKKYASSAELRKALQHDYLRELPSNFEPLCKEPNGDLFHFPVLVPEHVSRDEILKKLRVYGVFADRLWYKADDVFADRILQLPLTERMKEKDVHFICKLLQHVE